MSFNPMLKKTKISAVFLRATFMWLKQNVNKSQLLWGAHLTLFTWTVASYQPLWQEQSPAQWRTLPLVTLSQMVWAWAFSGAFRQWVKIFIWLILIAALQNNLSRHCILPSELWLISSGLKIGWLDHWMWRTYCHYMKENVGDLSSFYIWKNSRGRIYYTHMLGLIYFWLSFHCILLELFSDVYHPWRVGWLITPVIIKPISPFLNVLTRRRSNRDQNFVYLNTFVVWSDQCTTENNCHKCYFGKRS